MRLCTNFPRELIDSLKHAQYHLQSAVLLENLLLYAQTMEPNGFPENSPFCGLLMVKKNLAAIPRLHSSYALCPV